MPAFKIDEDMSEDAVTLLRAAGYDAISVIQQGMQGASDDQVIKVATSEQRTLVSLDLDFADIRTYPPASHYGIVVLRPFLEAKPAILRMMRNIIPLFQAEDVQQSLWIVDETRVRIRR